ncbi:MAG: hypothetical protein ACTSX6_10475 [Candidatus Heimdallarchaeaceae archaeon]
MLVTWSNLDYIIRQQELIIKQQELIISLLEQKLESKGLGLTIEIHCTMYHYRNGKLIAYSHHAAVLTNIGKDFIEGKLGDSSFGNNTKFAVYISLSNSTQTPSATWTVLPGEITTGGMSRAAGTYQSTGTGQWNITHTFSPTESNSTRLVGLHWDSSGDGNLLAADTITAINYQSGDSVQITWSISVS